MRNRIKATVRAQDSGSGRRRDELSQERPAAATHFPLEAQSRKASARTGRGGGSGGSCDPGSIVQRDHKGNTNAVNPRSGAGAQYQVITSTWSGGAGSSRGGC